ncbi:MAG: 50S ribosomal protein L6 [Acidobacteria bacterium]|nr:50S ribosomal protein L6 [Acidobacteriota bacterium]
MSRVGKKPIKIPAGVQVKVDGQKLEISGPKGKLVCQVPEDVRFETTDGQLVATRSGETREKKALHGLMRTLAANAIRGVTQGFRKELDLVGIGYKADAKGKWLLLTLGYSHPVEFPVPPDIQIAVEKQTKPLQNYIATIIVTGPDKQKVGQVAADIRGLRPPDPYKGKGIRYAKEAVRLKVGKKSA